MLLSTASMEERSANDGKEGNEDMEGDLEVGRKSDSEDPSWTEDTKEDAQLTDKMPRPPTISN